MDALDALQDELETILAGCSAARRHHLKGRAGLRSSSAMNSARRTQHAAQSLRRHAGHDDNVVIVKTRRARRAHSQDLGHPDRFFAQAFE